MTYFTDGKRIIYFVDYSNKLAKAYFNIVTKEIAPDTYPITPWQLDHALRNNAHARVYQDVIGLDVPPVHTHIRALS